ncbi:MAG: RpiB/LacA/LacB family sugar-phosphate isomerase [Deltaproteobacteria bacterium]|nr:RpiB/LacA/LacB family sugar-phosphate isomerase [Deltaproteobacteria bacterium]
MIEDLGAHRGKTIVFGYDRHVLPELGAYTQALGSCGAIVNAVGGQGQPLHYLTSAESVCRRMLGVGSGLTVGVLVCATGLGVCIAANKFRGLYAARCLSAEDARCARLVNNANVLCLAAASTVDVNRRIIDAFMTTPYEGRKLDELLYLRRLEMDDKDHGGDHHDRHHRGLRSIG